MEKQSPLETPKAGSGWGVLLSVSLTQIGLRGETLFFVDIIDTMSYNNTKVREVVRPLAVGFSTSEA